MLFKNHWRRWFDWRYLWLTYFLIMDIFRMVITIILLNEYYSPRYIIAILTAVFGVTVPPMIWNEILGNGLFTINATTCINRSIQTIKMLIGNFIIVSIVYIIFFITTYCFAASYAFYKQRKDITKSFILNQPSIYSYICSSDNIRDIQFRMVAINYCIVSIIDKEELHSQNLKNFIEESYTNGSTKSLLNFSAIRRNLNDTFKDHSSFFYFTTWIEYFEACQVSGKPTKNEWIINSFLSAADIVELVCVWTVPSILFIEFVMDKQVVSGLMICCIGWVTMECIMWWMMLMYLGPFYYCIQNYLPFLFNIHQPKLLNGYEQGEVLEFAMEITEALKVDEKIDDVVMDMVYPELVAQCIISYLRYGSLTDLIQQKMANKESQL